MEDKIAVTADGEYAAFNTGLLTPHAEEIFGFFQRNQHQAAQRWYFAGWVDRVQPEHPPELRRTASHGRVRDLGLRARRTTGDAELKLAYDHILGDNIDRFPARWLNSRYARGRRWTPQST